MTNKDHFDLIVIGSRRGRKPRRRPPSLAGGQSSLSGIGPASVARLFTTRAFPPVHEAALYISGFGHRDLYGVGLRMPHAQAPVQAVQGRRRHPRGYLTFLLPDVQRLLEQSGLSVEVHRLDGVSGLPDELRLVIATREIAPES